ncbi:MAG: hypothetical protein E6Q76_11060 [Rhizobium sp.]|nr:MAG: hypothetical protein E6Q76_11060 [Rhizobium sp.]
MRLRAGEESTLNIEDRRNDFLRRSLELFYAMGGEETLIPATAQEIYSADQPRVDKAVGDVMYKLAGIGHLYDLDMMQAAYNKLEDATRQMASIPLKRKI